jgi:beta-phosphoglucomutase-like phosphatase (HAD superfamily)
MIKLDGPLQGISWDCDGTTLDTKLDQFRWFNEIAVQRWNGTRCFEKFSSDFLAVYNDAYDTGQMPALYAMHGIDFDKHQKEIWPAYVEFTQKANTPAVPGMPAVIRNIFNASRIATGRVNALRMAINTSKVLACVEGPLTRHGILQRMDCIVTKDDVYNEITGGRWSELGIAFDDYKRIREVVDEQAARKLEKPNPYATRLTLQRLSGNPRAVIAFEDSRPGIRACKDVRLPYNDQRIDIPVVAVTWGFEDIDRLRSANPDEILTKPKQVYELVGDLGGFTKRKVA